MSTLIKKFRVDTLVWAIPLGAIIGAILAMAITSVMPKTYTSSTVLFIGSPAAGDSAGAYQGDLFSQQRAGTYAQLFAGDDLAVKVNDDLSLGLTPTELASKVTAAAVEKTVLLQVDVVDSSPTRAADIANAYADNFAQFVGQLENPTGGGQPSSLVTVITAAEAPAAPTSPSSSINMAAGVALGAALAGGFVYLRRRFDKHVRTVDGLAESAGAPVLGMLPGDADRRRSMLALPENSTDSYTERARKLRTTVQFIDVDKQKESLVVTGIGGATASREVAANLALLLTETGRTVVLVDADLRQPSLHDYVGTSDAALGLTDVLTGALMVEDAVVSVADGRLSFLSAGSASNTPGEDIASNLMRTVLAELARTFDHVVVSAPDAIEFADAAVLSHDVDGTIMVVVRGSSTVKDVSTGARAIQSTGGRLYGTVMVDRSSSGRKSGRPAVAATVKPAKVKPAKPAKVKAAKPAKVKAEIVAEPQRDEWTTTPAVDHVVVPARDRHRKDDDYRNNGFQDTGYQDAGYQDTGYQDTGYQDNGYQDAGYQDAGYRNDSYQNAGYQNTYRDDRYDTPVASDESATDPFPVVAQEAPSVSSSAGWAPAAPVRRPAPSRPFPRATLPPSARVSDKVAAKPTVEKAKPTVEKTDKGATKDAESKGAAPKAVSTVDVKKADSNTPKTDAPKTDVSKTDAPKTVAMEKVPVLSNDATDPSAADDAAATGSDDTDTTAIAIPGRSSRRSGPRPTPAQKGDSFVSSGRVRGRSR